MLQAQVMPFMSNSINSDYHYDHRPIIGNYKAAQDNEYAFKHGVPFETYAPLESNRFHRHDRLRDNLSFHDELESCSISRYQTLSPTFTNSKLAVGVNKTSLITTSLDNNREEMEEPYFEHLEDSGKNPDEEMEEDVDDDEFLEEEYEDAYRAQMTPDSPTRLLRFVRMVTTEIQSRFTRNKGNEDYCDVYEEKFKTTLSGRELYYADLLALASNSEAPSTSRRNRSSTTTATVTDDGCSSVRFRTVIYDPSGNIKSCTLPQQGRQIQECGLGPLEELFRFGLTWKVSTNPSTCSVSYKDKAVMPLQTSLQTSSIGHNNKTTREEEEESGHNLPTVPMIMRKLPSSFWEEPGCRTRDHVILPSVNNTPDFTDLFNQWTDK